MALCSTIEAISEIKKGRMIILVDDEDRENEGDLTIAAEFVTPEIINFMAHHGCGLICLSLAPDICDKLQAAHDGQPQHLAVWHELHCLH